MMALRGVGLDIVDLRHFGRSAARPGFLERILGPRELEQLPAEEPARTRMAACCFAYKEAVLKALGTGAWQEGTTFRDVRLLFESGPDAPPEILLHAAAARVLQEAGGGRLLSAHELVRGKLRAVCFWLR